MLLDKSVSRGRGDISGAAKLIAVLSCFLFCRFEKTTPTKWANKMTTSIREAIAFKVFCPWILVLMTQPLRLMGTNSGNLSSSCPFSFPSFFYSNWSANTKNIGIYDWKACIHVDKRIAPIGKSINFSCVNIFTLSGRVFSSPMPVKLRIT